MKKIMNNKKGFSFLELMITIAIAGIMTGAILVSMNTQREKKTVEAAAREVAATVRETQNYALTGKKLAGLSACVYGFGWTGAGYNMNGCDSQSYSLKNGVTFNNSGSFSFSVPFATLNVSSTVDIILVKNSSFYHVCIYNSGVVKENVDGC